VADPAGATNYIPITSDRTKLAASMPDAGNTFAADLVIDQALGINYEGGAATFIDGLAAACADLRVFDATATYELPFGVKQFVQTPGSRKLILGLGVPSTAPLLSSADVTYRLYRGCTGGSYQNKAGVVPTADGWVGAWQMSDGSGATLSDWTANGYYGTLTNMDPETDWVASALGGWALNFDGIDDVVRVGNQAAFRLQAWTYEALVRCTDLTTVLAKLILGTYDKDNSVSYAGSTLGIGDGTSPNNAIPRGFCKAGGYNHLLASNNPVTLNQWHLLMFTRDGSGNQVIYVDGAVGNSATFASTVDYTNAYTAIGNPYTSVTADMKGDIGPCSIAGASRSANWVASLANNRLSNGAFWTVGAEVPLAVPGTRLFHPRLNAGFNPRLY